MVKNTNIAVLDTSSVKEVKAHMRLDEVVSLALKYDTIIIPTHMQPYTKFEARKVILKNFKLFNDGEVIEI